MSDPGDDTNEALFAILVEQQSNMALLMMGRMPDPSTGTTHTDLEKAALFIDTLAMLESRTKGNLSKLEETFLKETLVQLRMTYVKATKDPVETTSQAPAENQPDAQPEASAEASPPPAGPAEESASDKTPEPGPASSPPDPGPESPPETKKKFTKKY